MQPVRPTVRAPPPVAPHVPESSPSQASPAPAGKPKSWLLTSTNLADTNEPDAGELKVKLAEETLDPDKPVSVPRASLRVLVWE